MPNLYSIGLFASANGQAIASTEKTVISTGYSVDGIGAETYAYDPALSGSYVTDNPRTSFAAADGRVFKLAPMSKPLATAFGARVDPSPPLTPIQVANSEAIQAAMRWGPFLLPPGTIWCDPGTPIIPWALGTSGTVSMEGTGNKGITQASILRWVTDGTHERPCIFIPEGYINGKNNKLYDADDNVHAATTGGPPTGRQVVFKNLHLSAGTGRYATIMFLTNMSNNLFENCLFTSGHRGVMDVSSFGSTIIDCSFSGLYYSAGRTQTEVETQFRESYGLYITGHFSVLNASIYGWGTGISCGGPGSTIMNTRMEVGECAVRLGGATNYFWTYWNGSAWTGGTLTTTGLNFNSCATESNRWGILMDAATGCRLTDLTVTGNANAVPAYDATALPALPKRNPAAGLVVSSTINNTNIIDNCTFGFTGVDYSAVINAGAVEWRRSPTVLGARAAWSTISDRWRITQSVPNQFKDNGLSSDRAVVTCDSQTALRGVTGFDGANALVFSNNVGAQNVAVATSATSAAVTFPAAKGIGTAAFTAGPAAVTDGTSTLAAGTYWYATTIVGKRGETGANWRPLFDGSTGTDLTYKKVTVASGERVDMSWNSTGAGYFRRVYRGSTSGLFDGFWELVGTATSFSDKGMVAFDGKDYPPGNAGFIPAQAEVDASFGIVVTPSWNTKYWITGKATSGFTVNFSDPAPAGATFDWFLFRG